MILSYSGSRFMDVDMGIVGGCEKQQIVRCLRDSVNCDTPLEAKDKSILTQQCLEFSDRKFAAPARTEVASTARR